MQRRTTLMTAHGPSAAILSAMTVAPFPRRCPPPMLAMVGPLPEPSDGFSYELAWGGCRMLAAWDGREMALHIRNEAEVVDLLPEIRPLARSLNQPMILDGELIAMDGAGRADPAALRARLPHPTTGARGRRHGEPPRSRLHFLISDILHWDGRDSCVLPFAARRELLESLDLRGDAWHVVPTFPDGASLLEHARRGGQDGIIAKRLRGVYAPGRRSRDWIKVPVADEEDFVVLGSWSSGKHGLSALILGQRTASDGERAGARLRFCGKVGTGFSELERERLQRLIEGLRSEGPPAADDLPSGSGLTWCHPSLVARVRFAGWTEDGALRYPVFVSLRSESEPSATGTRAMHTPTPSPAEGAPLPDPQVIDTDTHVLHTVDRSGLAPRSPRGPRRAEGADRDRQTRDGNDAAEDRQDG